MGGPPALGTRQMFPLSAPRLKSGMKYSPPKAPKTAGACDIVSGVRYNGLPEKIVTGSATDCWGRRSSSARSPRSLETKLLHRIRHLLGGPATLREKHG